MGAPPRSGPATAPTNRPPGSTAPTNRPPGSTAPTNRPAGSTARTIRGAVTGPTGPTSPGACAAARATATLESHGTLVLNRYRLHKPLGAGGFGTVWLAYDERLARDVAVKMLPRPRVISGRFEREARAAARLNHPGIVTLYEAAVDDDAAYLVSELVRGATFAELLEAGRLSDRDIVTLGIGVCDALEHAHAQGVVHRDVKPSNILVPDHPSSPAAVAKLTDFGVARVIGGNTLTRTGEVVGTAGYMAPEQAEGREADAAADLYSLALVLYEALTGLNPIATGPAAPRGRRLGAHLPPLRRYRRDLPAELGRTIDLALRPRAGERGGIRQLRAGLLATLDEVGDEPGVVESPWPGGFHDHPDGAGPRWLHAFDAPPNPADPRFDPARNGSDPRSFDDPPRHGRAAFGQSPQDDSAPGEAPRFRWPERALAGAATAGIAWWLAATAFSSPPLPAPAAALFAGVGVYLLPRIGWLVLMLSAGVALAVNGSPGAAIVVCAAMLLPVLLLPTRPTRWPLAAASPALGAAMLAGAWPALAGRDRGPWRRAALGGLGWIFLIVAGAVAGHGAYLKLPGGINRRAQWIGSADHTVGHVLWPLFHTGALAPAIIWAAAAALLPWIVRGPMPVRIVLVTVWSAAVAAATTSALHSAGPVLPGAVVLGAVAGAIVALAPAVLRKRKKLSASSDTGAGLA